MDGSVFHVVAHVHLCPRCKRITWQPHGQNCLLCQRGAATRA